MIEFQSSHPLPLFSQSFQQILCGEKEMLPTQRFFFKKVITMLHRSDTVCVCINVIFNVVFSPAS